MASLIPKSSPPSSLESICHSCLSSRLTERLICEPSQWTTNILKCTQNVSTSVFLLIKTILTATGMAFPSGPSLFAQLSQHICTCRRAHDKSNVKTEEIREKRVWIPFPKISNAYVDFQSNPWSIARLTKEH